MAAKSYITKICIAKHAMLVAQMDNLYLSFSLIYVFHVIQNVYYVQSMLHIAQNVSLALFYILIIINVRPYVLLVFIMILS
jgi:hypothetical protein